MKYLNKNIFLLYLYVCLIINPNLLPVTLPTNKDHAQLHYIKELHCNFINATRTHPKGTKKMTLNSMCHFDDIFVRAKEGIWIRCKLLQNVKWAFVDTLIWQ